MTPDLLLHFISAHGYLPPRAFLDAVEAFPLDQPFDAEEHETPDLEVELEVWLDGSWREEAEAVLRGAGWSEPLFPEGYVFRGAEVGCPPSEQQR